MNERDTLTLTFTNMDLEGHPDCVFDYVEVNQSDLYFSYIHILAKSSNRPLIIPPAYEVLGGI